MSSGFRTRLDSYQSAQLQRLGRMFLIFCNFACFKFINYTLQREITKVLIRLLGSAGWSAPLFFGHIKVSFSSVMANISQLAR